MTQSERSKWDFGRFFQTLVFFEVIPLFNCLSRLLQGNFKYNKNRPDGENRVGDILVDGAFQSLIGIYPDLPPHNNTLAHATAGEKLVFDFTNPNENLKQIWGAVDDVVMGGVSESTIRMIDDAVLFTGNVSTANSGGFASVRTRNFEEAIDLTGYSGVELRVKGDGKRYKFFIRTETKWDGVGYSYSFDTAYNSWITVRIPFAEFIPVFRAKTLKDAEPINTSKICSLQLMLSKFEYDGELNPHFEPGGFALEVKSIKAYGGTALP